MESVSHQVTQLLHAWSEGEPQALDRLTPLVYEELHRLARCHMAHERPGHTLQTTALVNEAYLELVDSVQADWQNRAHFFAVCARVMRRILVDWARSRNMFKRGGGVHLVGLEDTFVGAQEPDAALVALDDALSALAECDARKARVVELRFFGGLSIEETAAVLRISEETVQRDWRFAKSWLRRELSAEKSYGV